MWIKNGQVAFHVEGIAIVDKFYIHVTGSNDFLLEVYVASSEAESSIVFEYLTCFVHTPSTYTLESLQAKCLDRFSEVENENVAA